MQKRIEYLDWLRALAAAFVVLGHSMNPIVPAGAIGVSVFFTLSGFLIATILLRDGMLTIPNICKFIVRRVARIYPMYVVSIFSCVAFFWFYRPEHIDLATRDLPGLLTFRTGTSVWLGYGFGVLWTLAIEFWFYVTFPFLLWLAASFRVVIPAILLGILVSLAAKITGNGSETLKYYDQFLLGSLAAALIKSGTVPAFFAHNRAVPFGFAALMLIAATPLFQERGLLWTARDLSTCLITAGIILAAHARPPRISLPIAAYLGRISYSAYLVHGVVLDYWFFNFGPISDLPIYLATVVAISSLTYFTIERTVEARVHRVVRYGLQTA